MRENYIISRNLKTENISSNTFSYSGLPFIHNTMEELKAFMKIAKLI